jgi:hypothetical protein
MGARLGTVPGWERTSSTFDEPREYEGVGPSKIIMPNYDGTEIMEYWVRFDLDLNFCDSPPINPIVIRTLKNILITQKFVIPLRTQIPNFQDWIENVTEAEAEDIWRMSHLEIAGLGTCGNIEDSYNIRITGQGKKESPKPILLNIDELKEIQKKKEKRKEQEKEKQKLELIEEKNKIELIKNQIKIYKEMKKTPEPLIQKVSEQMIDYYEERQKELIKQQEKKKKAEINKIKKLEKKQKLEKKKEIKIIKEEKLITFPTKKELTAIDIAHLNRIQKDITKLEKKKTEQQQFLNITLGAIERTEESGRLDFLLNQVVTRDRFIDDINRTTEKIKKQKDALIKIQGA